MKISSPALSSVRRVLPLAALALGGLLGCSSESPGETGKSGGETGAQGASPVVANYVAMVRANYAEARGQAEALKAAVDALVAAPSEATLEAARKAWLEARPSYGQSEAYRFYGGPIDDDDGPEARINGWPLDEAYIDYVEGDEGAGIVNRPEEFPEITKALIAEQNELGGEKNISAGFHAVEFLLWGQDTSDDGPGARPFTDYVTDGSGTAQNQERRGAYLELVAELLVDDLRSVEAAWQEGEGSYAQGFAASPTEALSKMMTGMGSLSGAELSSERMNNALQEQDQEEEHSCFSDSTHADLLANAVAVENVYLGRYGALDGPGVDDLVRAEDPALADRLAAELTASRQAIEAIPIPFDRAIQSEDGRAKIQAAIDALKAETATIASAATLLGLTLNLEE